MIEVKKDHSGTFRNGLDDQLPGYLASDDTNEGWFVSIRYRDTKVIATRLRRLPLAVRDAAQRTGKTLHYISIDGAERSLRRRSGARRALLTRRAS